MVPDGQGPQIVDKNNIHLLPNSGLAAHQSKINTCEASVGRMGNVASNQRAGNMGRMQTQRPQKRTLKILPNHESF